MEKSPDAFRTISEVADHLDTPAHVLRFWESRFPQIKPVKRAGGRRYYRPTDVALLEGIKRLLHDEGLTIRGVQKILREQGIKHVAGLADEPSAEEVALEVALGDLDPAKVVAMDRPAVQEAQVTVLQDALSRLRPKTEPAQADLFVAPQEPEPEPAPAADPDAMPEGPTIAARLRALPRPSDAVFALKLTHTRDRIASLRGRMGRAARPGIA
jgi:DNA-binding transcriptional MerR regulator